MEISPNKRRRLTPSNFNSKISGTNFGSDDGTPGSAVKASYLSPTKASLARFNPHLLPRAKSSEPSMIKLRPNSRKLDEDQEGRRHHNVSIRYRSEPLASLIENKTIEATQPQPIETHTSEMLGGSPSVKPHNSSNTEGFWRSQEIVSAVDSSTVDAHTALLLSSDRNDTRDGSNGASVSRVVPAIDEIDVNKLPATPTRHHLPLSSLAGNQDGKDLALTPLPRPETVASPNNLIRPLGQSEDSGTRRSGRRHSRYSLTPRDEHVGHSELLADPASVLGPKIYLGSLPGRPLTMEDKHQHEASLRLSSLEQEYIFIEQDLIRKRLLTKWYNTNSIYKSQLEKSYDRMKKLAKKMDAMHKQIRLPHSGRGNDLSQRRVSPSEEIKQSREHKSLTDTNIRANMNNFLPFGQRRVRPLPSPHTAVQGALNSPDDEDISAPILVHFTLAEPLRLLPASDTLGEPSNKRDHQLALYSADNDLIAKIRLTIGSSSLALVSLDLLEIAPWVALELKSHLQDVQAKALSVTDIGTAVGRWWQVANLRADCWRCCAAKYPNLTTFDGVCARSCYPGPASLQATSVDGHPSLSCEGVTFVRGSVSLTVSWRILIREDSDVASQIAASLDTPDTWTESSINQVSLGEQVTEAFHLLVKERGVTGGICVLVDMLYPSTESV